MLLLPPYVSVSELRIIFRLDYASTFRLLSVVQENKKYYWTDFDGRQFETTSKRKVLVPFEMVAPVATNLGYRPKMVDVEPDWEVSQAWASGGGSASSTSRPGGIPEGKAWTLAAAVDGSRTGEVACAVPVVAVLGHIDHGKTTLLDALCGTDVAPTEPGGITQNVRAMTWRLTGPRGPRLDVLPYSPERARRLDRDRMTFLDTPGHEAFELLRGRTMAAADAAIVVVSVEHGVEVQTEEVLMHAARWQVPVVFALNKIDLPDAHVDLTRAELRRQCQRLYENGLVDVDWTEEAEQAVPISALLHKNLDGLVQRVCDAVSALPAVPAKAIEPPTLTPGEGKACKNVQRRTDFLIGIEPSPSCVALVVEVERGADTGENVLTVLVRSGRLSVGQFFAVGTAFGRISHLSIATGTPDHSWYKAESATVGMSAQIIGMRTRKVGGDCAADDLLFALPRERAYRLSAHRKRIEELTMLQTAGPAVEVPWEHDAHNLITRTQAGFERDRHEHPEKHAKSAYERRWAQPAVEEHGSPDGVPTTFSDATRRDFQAPAQAYDRFASDLPAAAADLAAERAAAAERADAAEPKARGRKSRRQAATPSPPEGNAAGQTSPDLKRFMAVPVAPEAGDEAKSDDKPAGGGGRRSFRAADAKGRQRLPPGAWTETKPVEKEFVYYVDRESYVEEAEIDSTRLRSRWRWRDRARWEEQQRQKDLVDQEKKVEEAIRREVFGEASGDSDAEDDPKGKAPRDASESDEEEPLEPLPMRNRPVVSLILKTRTMGHFDLLMDEIEQVGEKYGVRCTIVHGGLGPVIPKDVVHAEVEKEYGLCPIYAFQVGSSAEATRQADAESIDMRRFDVFTDLVEDLEERCEQLQGKKRLSAYAGSLRQRPTRSGL